jgi:hypothetical protein
MQITFDSEAGESYQRALEAFTNYTVEITAESGDKFDAILLGVDREAGWYGAVVVRAVEGEEPVGHPFTVRADAVKVY